MTLEARVSTVDAIEPTADCLAARMFAKLSRFSKASESHSRTFSCCCRLFRSQRHDSTTRITTKTTLPITPPATAPILGFELFPTGALLTELIFMHFVSAHVVHDWLTKEHEDQLR